MLIQVITSWQVIAVTLVIVIYFSIVSYVARVHHRSNRRPPTFRSKTPKSKAKKAEAAVPDENDELGLEESG